MKPSRGLEMKFEGIHTDDAGNHTARVAVRVRRFWLPFFAAEMVEPWYVKPIVFAWAVWRFWIVRDK